MFRFKRICLFVFFFVSMFSSSVPGGVFVSTSPMFSVKTRHFFVSVPERLLAYGYLCWPRLANSATFYCLVLLPLTNVVSPCEHDESLGMR